MTLQHDDGSATTNGSAASEEAAHDSLHVSGRLVDASELACEERWVGAAVVTPGRGDETCQTTRTPVLQGSSLSLLANGASTSRHERRIRGASDITSQREERSGATSQPTTHHGLKSHAGSETRGSSDLESGQLTASIQGARVSLQHGGCVSASSMDQLRALRLELRKQSLSLVATEVRLDKRCRALAESFDLAHANALSMLQLRQRLACSKAAHASLQYLNGRLALKLSLMSDVRIVDASEQLTSRLSRTHGTLDDHSSVLALLLQQLKRGDSLLTSSAESTPSKHGPSCTLDVDRTCVLQHAKLFSTKTLLLLEDALLCRASTMGRHHQGAVSASMESAHVRLDIDSGTNTRCVLSAQEQQGATSRRTAESTLDARCRRRLEETSRLIPRLLLSSE